MTLPIDLRTREEVAGDVVEIATQRLDDANADAQALSFASVAPLSGQAVTAQTFPEVDAAAPGVFSEDDYVAGIPMPSSLSELTTFGQIFSDLKNSFLALVSGDTNLALALLVRECIAILSDLEAVAQTVKNEAAKISVAAASGLLTPPSPVGLQKLRESAACVVAEGDLVASDLGDGSRRRDAARSGEPRPVNPRTGLSPPTNVSETLFSPQPPGAPGAPLEAERVSLADDRLRECTAELRIQVLDNIKTIAICQLISNLDTSEEQKRKSQRAIKRLTELFEKIIKGGIINDLLGGINELALENIQTLNDDIRKQLKSLDDFLGLLGKRTQLPLFVSLVQNIGDTAGDLSITNSVLADCGLRMEKLCDAQGLLEAAQAIDNALGLGPTTPTRLGLVCLSVNVPERQVDEAPPLQTRPDREASLILSAPGSSSVIVARFPRDKEKIAVTGPTPTVSGNVFGNFSVDERSIVIAVPDNRAVATSGVIVLPGSGSLRYSSFNVQYGSSTPPTRVIRVELLDPLSVAEFSGNPVTIDGEHRNQFDNVYRPREEISGGPGRMRLGGDDEVVEDIEYSHSTFDTATGDYTFYPSSRPSPSPHVTQVVGTPSPFARRMLFRDTSSVGPAPRFNVVIDPASSTPRKIIPAVPGTPPNMSSQITAGMSVILSDDANNTPVTIAAVGSDFAMLSEAYFNGAVDNVTVSQADERSAAGGSQIRARLSQRVVDELRLADTDAPQARSVRILADQGDASRVFSRSDGVIGAASAGLVPLQTLAPIFSSEEVGSLFTFVQPSGRTVNGVVSAVPGPKSVTISFSHASVVSQNQLTCSSYSSGGGNVFGTGTRFTRELKVGDGVMLDSAGPFRVTSIASDTSMSLSPDPGLTLGSSIFRAAPPIVGGVKFSFRRQATEKLTVSSFQRTSGAATGSAATSAIWTLSTASPTQKSHGVQELSVSTTVQIVPGSLTAFPATPTPTTPRFEPDIVPVGATVIRASFPSASEADVIFPLIMLSTEVQYGQRKLTAGSLTRDPGSAEVVITLTDPLPISIPAGAQLCVATADTITNLLKNLLPDPAWKVPFDTWSQLLDKSLRDLNSQICKILQGQPMDVAATALAINVGCTLFIIAVSALRLTLEVLLLGFGNLDQIDAVVSRARDSGMTALADAMVSGDVGAVAGMRESEATSEGAAVAKIAVYREKAETFTDIGAVDSLVAELRGSETSTRLLAEMRIGFNGAAGDEIKSRQEAANRLRQKAETVLT